MTAWSGGPLPWPTGAELHSSASGTSALDEGSWCLPNSVPDPTDEPHSISAWTEFHEAVSDLPEDQREVFSLLWYSGLTQADAARVLGISLATLKRRWVSARLILKEKCGGDID